jgi:hypothetical protein
MTGWANEIKQLLADGLYLHNLRRIMECCEQGFKEEQHALPAYVIRSVIADLHREWEGQAVRVDDARRTETRLLPHLEAVVAALLRGDSLEAISAPLSSLVRAWVSL